MSTLSKPAATLDDLQRVKGKAELIARTIVHLMPTGFRPGQVGGRIYRGLDDHAVANGQGVALPDNVGFAVPERSSGRQTFSPDVSYFLGSPPPDEVEVRSKEDYGATAEAEMAAKRADYFEAGTLVVWDVDIRAELVRVYRASAPDQPTVFGRGEVADAEPVVPGWRLSVDPIFA